MVWRGLEVLEGYCCYFKDISESRCGFSAAAHLYSLRMQTEPAGKALVPSVSYGDAADIFLATTA